MRPAAEPREPQAAGVPAMAGGSPEADEESIAGVDPDAPPTPKGTRCLAILAPAGIAAGATILFGVFPSPLVDWASNAGQALAAFLA
jgi:hypothetical protein